MAPRRTGRATDVGTTALVATIAGLIATILGMLLSIGGLVIRATSAYTRLQVEVRSVVADLEEHIKDARGERADLRATVSKQMDNITTTLSRVDRDVARLSGRRRDSGIA